MLRGGSACSAKTPASGGGIGGSGRGNGEKKWDRRSFVISSQFQRSIAAEVRIAE